MATQTTSSRGIGLPGLLTLAFIVLRLIPYKTGHLINWSWWWVLSPLWIAFALFLLIVIAVLIAAGVKN